MGNGRGIIPLHGESDGYLHGQEFILGVTTVASPI